MSAAVMTSEPRTSYTNAMFLELHSANDGRERRHLQSMPTWPQSVTTAGATRKHDQSLEAPPPTHSTGGYKEINKMPLTTCAKPECPVNVEM